MGDKNPPLCISSGTRERGEFGKGSENGTLCGTSYWDATAKDPARARERGRWGGESI